MHSQSNGKTQPELNVIFACRVLAGSAFRWLSSFAHTGFYTGNILAKFLISFLSRINIAEMHVFLISK